MRGGKREGAGRKGRGLGKTKVYRLPIELEPQIIELLNKYKNGNLESVTKSIDTKKSNTIKPTHEQIKRLQIWLLLHEFSKSHTEGRKLTASNKIKETVLKCSEIARQTAINQGGKHDQYTWVIQDLIDLFS